MRNAGELFESLIELISRVVYGSFTILSYRIGNLRLSGTCRANHSMPYAGSVWGAVNLYLDGPYDSLLDLFHAVQSSSSRILRDSTGSLDSK